MRSIEPSPRGLIEIFRPQKRERHFLFHVKKQFTGGVFLSKKPASSLNTREGLDKMLTSFLPNLFPHGEGGIGRLGHFVSLAGIPLSFNTRDTPLSIRERDWTRCSLRFRPISSLMEREGLDSAVIPFRQFLSQYERGIGRLGHFVSLAGIPLSQYERHPSLKDERGIGQDAHFVSAQSLPSWRREELDSAVIPFRQLLSQYERGIGQEAHFVSHLALRVTAGGRNP